MYYLMSTENKLQLVLELKSNYLFILYFWNLIAADWNFPQWEAGQLKANEHVKYQNLNYSTIF
jgi:hypothetical protein